MLSKHKDKFRGFEKAVANVFSKLPLSPNVWTLLSLVTAIISVYFISTNNLLIAAIILLITAFVDVIDGAVARATGRATKFGAYLDTVVDRYVEGLIILSLLLVALPVFLIPASIWIGLYLFGSLMTTYVKAAAKEQEIVRSELRGGLLERAERLLILFVGLVLGSLNAFWLTYVLVVLAVLTNLTALQKAMTALGAAKRSV